MVPVAVALGSNLGDRLARLQSAVQRLSECLRVSAVSHAFVTEPMYVQDQPDFLNAALIGHTDLGPLELLRALKEIEAHEGRGESARFGPRELDLDLIGYGRLRYHCSILGRTVLEVPHPKLAERRFVLAPLAEIAPDLELPGMGNVCELLAATDGQSTAVKILSDAVLSIRRHGRAG
jgi:2-amino-4-hydroxy-6-hydroxymethyldihydropteridine diphosphokinase